MSFRSHLLGASVGVLAVASIQAAEAITITASTTPSFPLEDLSSLAPPGAPGFQNADVHEFGSFGNLVFFFPGNEFLPPATTGGGVYQGSVLNPPNAADVAKSPYGPADTRNYLLAQGPQPPAPEDTPEENPNDVGLIFDAHQTTFSLLWGSVDPWNELLFLDANGNFEDPVTGSEVAAAAGVAADSTTNLYVTISGFDSGYFTALVATSGHPAFEFVPEQLPTSTLIAPASASLFAASATLGDPPPDPIPEPASLALLGVGLLGLGVFRLRSS